MVCRYPSSTGGNARLMAIWPGKFELKLANAAQNCSTNSWWFFDHSGQHLGGVEVSFPHG